MLQKATTFVGQIVALAILATLPVCFGQVQAGRIVGTVTDPNKAVVPNAKVVIANTATNQAQTLTTNGAGDFVLTPVNPGVYRIEVTASGFGTAEINNVEVIIGQSTPADVALRLGGHSTQIEDTAKTNLINTRSGTLAQDINNKHVPALALKHCRLC